MPVPHDVGTTVGVEEEFHLIGAGGALSENAAAVLERAGDDRRPGGGDHRSDDGQAGDEHACGDEHGNSAALEPELQRSMVEAATDVCRTLGEVREAVRRHRALALEAAESGGLRLVASGTVPTAGLRPVDVFPKERYTRMHDMYRGVVSEQQVCASQTQVGVLDRDLAVALLPRLAPWLAVLLAMSASSPFFSGEDTGYASWRTMTWSRWPTAGPTGPFASAAEYDATVDGLIRSGAILDSGMIYFDVRASKRFPTVEIRVADAMPLMDDVVLLAALGRALVVRAAGEEAAGAPMQAVRPELLRAASWRAARSGLDDVLIDPVAAEPVAAGVLIDRLLVHVGDALDASEDRAEVVELAAALRSRGTSAARQRAAYQRRGRLEDVADLLADETRTGV